MDLVVYVAVTPATLVQEPGMGKWRRGGSSGGRGGGGGWKGGVGEV